MRVTLCRPTVSEQKYWVENLGHPGSGFIEADAPAFEEGRIKRRRNWKASTYTRKTGKGFQ
jgi:hypothetical protein